MACRPLVFICFLNYNIFKSSQAVENFIIHSVYYLEHDWQQGRCRQDY